MEPARDPALRPLADVIGAGVVAGAIAGLAAGTIDAIWSWGPAAQFVRGFLGRVRFVVFSGLTDAAAGALAGLVLAAVLLLLSRGSRIGDLLRYGWRDHLRRREAGERPVAGLAIVLVALPCIGAALVVAFRWVVKFTAGRQVGDLQLLVAMVAAFAAVAIAIPVAFVIARQVEHGLQAIARHPRARVLTSPYAPFVAIGALGAAGALVAVILWWESARVLQLRAPLVAVVGGLLALAAWRPALYLVLGLRARRRRIQIAAWAGGGLLVLLLVLATGGSAPVIKAASAYTGLGGHVARVLRVAFDWDRDGYARFLGGGDCDDGNAAIHPGAPEQPGDGVDQNCVGGDPDPHPPAHDPAFAPVPASVPKDFNVILITIDTTRADHLGTYGYPRPTTPNLDKLAEAGTVFENGWAHAPSTRYSMPAILTGRLPLDVYYDYSVWWPGLLPKATTIAEVLDTVGFTSGAITNYRYFETQRHMNQGFAEYDNSNASLHMEVANAGPEQTHGSSSRQQSDKAIAYVDRHAADRFFLWVHYYDPHYGYEPHPEVPSFGNDRMALYDGELRFTDMHIGRLIDELKAKGLYDKTVIVVTGDHGEGFGEHGVELHGYHLYAAQTKVPLIIRVPGLAPRRSAEPAGHVDILPTLANLAGAAPSPEMMGTSLVPALAGKDDTSRTVFQQLSYEGNHEMRGGVGVGCHVIYNVSPDTSWEVYRVDGDPMESDDLAETDTCADTRSAVAKWFDAGEVPPQAVQALLPARPQLASSLDADLGDKVRLLAVDAPAQARRGETVTLTWTFEAKGAVSSDWRMFVHIAGAAPGKFINGDHKPARPFEWWKAGDFIRYTTTVVIPQDVAPGKYTVWAGMFDKTGKRARVAAPKAAIADDAVAAATLEIQP